jgi:hypothetical protein
LFRPLALSSGMIADGEEFAQREQGLERGLTLHPSWMRSWTPQGRLNWMERGEELDLESRRSGVLRWWWISRAGDGSVGCQRG